MKLKHWIFAAGCLSLSQWAIGQSSSGFQVVQGGVTYQCTPISGGGTSPGTGAVDCANRAFQGPFSRAESQEICQGAWSEAPALCAIRAFQGPFSRQESIDLCKGAIVLTDGPDACATKAFQGPFSRAESLRLCAGGTVANFDCAIKAFQGPYSREESIKMCAARP